MSSTTASSSACACFATAETVTGSHVLTIDGYSKTKAAISVGDCVESERFLVGGHSWYIECYPCGEDEEVAGWVSIFLCLDRYDGAMDGEVKATTKFALLDRAGDTLLLAAPSAQVVTFSSTHDSAWGLDKFIKITELEESCLLSDDQDFFQIRCDVTVIKEPTGGDTHRHLGDLLASQEAGRDVTFEVGGEQFTAHRCVLAARSTVFMAELFGGPGKLQQNTANTSHIRVEGMEPKVFKALLHFIYTDSFPEVDEGESKVAMAQGLLAAADRYGLEGLKLVCGDVLCSYIDEATALTTLQLARKHGCHKLKEACTKFVNDVLADVCQV